MMVISLIACTVDPSKHRAIDPKQELEKLEAPNVPSIEQSLEKNAIAALKGGENSRALSLYQQLYDKKPEEERYILGFAESMRRVGDNENAITKYDLLIDKHPGHLDAIEGKALAKMSAGQLDDATRLFSLIMTRDGKRWRTLNALGVMFAAKNMPKDAQAYFEEAKKYSNDNPSILNNMGLSQAIAREYKTSVKTLRMASNKSEGIQRKHIELNLALVYGISGNMKQARKIAERYLQGASLDNNLGLYSHLANNDEMAKSYLNMALTGSTQHYERAWDNLDKITAESKRDHTSGDDASKNYSISSPLVDHDDDQADMSDTNASDGPPAHAQSEVPAHNVPQTQAVPVGTLPQSYTPVNQPSQATMTPPVMVQPQASAPAAQPNPFAPVQTPPNASVVAPQQPTQKPAAQPYVEPTLQPGQVLKMPAQPAPSNVPATAPTVTAH